MTDREKLMKASRESLKTLASKNVKPTSLKDVIVTTMNDVSNPDTYAQEISAILNDGTSSATVLSGSSPRIPHEYFPLLALISGYRKHMSETPSQMISDKNDFELASDLINAMFRVIDLRSKANLMAWSRVITSMIPRILRGTKPTTAFDHTSKDLSVSDAPVKNPRSFTTTTRTTRRTRKEKAVAQKGMCVSYFTTGKCKFGNNCWHRHNCPKCGRIHFPNCYSDKSDDNK